jgi:hypothetical protein
MPETGIAVIEQAVMLEAGTPQAIALGKENIVDAELKRIEQAYKGLRVKGLDDVQGIKLVSDARKYCKKVRTTTERICEAGRAPAFAEHQRWLKVEKYVVGRVSAVEKELIAEESRIEALKEAKREKEARRLKAEEDRLDAICFEFAQLGKPHTKDEIRAMECGIVEALLTAAHTEKAEKDEAERLEKEKQAAETKRLQNEKVAADREVKRLQDERAEAEEKAKAEADALRDKIAALEAEVHAKETPAYIPAPISVHVPDTAPIPDHAPVPVPVAVHAPVHVPEPAPAPTEQEAELISQDKTALLDFAEKLLILKNYLPVVHSQKALDFNAVISEQVDKFAAFVTKKSETL